MRGYNKVALYFGVTHRSLASNMGEAKQPLLVSYHPLPPARGRNDSNFEEKKR